MTSTRALLSRSEVAMGTIVTIRVPTDSPEVDTAVERAFGWFHEIESRCSRFSPDSELTQVAAQAGKAVAVSPILFEAVRFAVLVAEESGGAFDPTVGYRMEERGFNLEHRSGEVFRSSNPSGARVSYRDVELNPDRSTVTLRRQLTLDLGAVAKGLAIDTAARELRPLRDFSIDAGGDLYLGGVNPEGAPWRVGIRHPRLDGELIEVLTASDVAVCTSGDYERGEHIIDPRMDSSHPPQPASGRAVSSATVVASGAMLADALATAAFVLGPREGLDLLNRVGVEGLIVTADLERFETKGLRRARKDRDAA